MQRVFIGQKIQIVVNYFLLLLSISALIYEGQTSIRRIVDCIDENHATTCFALGANNIYHMITIRSITEKELSFDWFLVDNRILFELPQLSCTFK